MQCNDFLTELISEDLHTAALRGKSQQISEKTLLPLVIYFLQSFLSGIKLVLAVSAQLSCSYDLCCGA